MGQSLGFSYDTANRLVGIDNALNGTLSQNFDYGDESRVVSMESTMMTASYSYDMNGNRTTSMQGGASNSTSYSTTSNHIVSTTGSNPQTYGYDALGNVTTLGGTTVYQYDAFNRMSTAGGMTYYVNPEGQRLRKTGSLGTTYFAPDQGGTLMAEDDSGAWIDYLWLGGRLIGREVNGQLEVIGDDQVGRPQVVTNAAQTVVWSAQNWPYTQNVTVSNSAPLNLGFPGQYYDQETGLWNNGFRDYDPTLGRYVESDPLGLAGGSWSTYAYVDGNPLSGIDPLGLCDQQKCTAARAALAAQGQQLSSTGKAMTLSGVGVVAADAVAELFAPEGVEAELPIDEVGTGMIELGGQVSTLGSTVQGYARGGVVGAAEEFAVSAAIDKVSNFGAGKMFSGFTDSQKAATSSLLGQVLDSLQADEAACNEN